MTTHESSALTPDIQALVGKEWVFTCPEETGRASIRKFALAIGDHNPFTSTRNTPAIANTEVS